MEESQQHFGGSREIQGHGRDQPWSNSPFRTTTVRNWPEADFHPGWPPDGDGDTGRDACCHDGLPNRVRGITAVFDNMRCSGGPLSNAHQVPMASKGVKSSETWHPSNVVWIGETQEGCKTQVKSHSLSMAHSPVPVPDLFVTQYVSPLFLFCGTLKIENSKKKAT